MKYMLLALLLIGCGNPAYYSGLGWSVNENDPRNPMYGYVLPKSGSGGTVLGYTYPIPGYGRYDCASCYRFDYKSSYYQRNPYRSFNQYNGPNRIGGYTSSGVYIGKVW